jgi:hypothetical protein
LKFAVLLSFFIIPKSLVAEQLAEEDLKAAKAEQEAEEATRQQKVKDNTAHASAVHKQHSNQSFYMDKVYPKVKKEDNDQLIALNNYLISQNNARAAKAKLGPEIDVYGDIGKHVGRGDFHNESDFADGGVTLFQPIFSLARYYEYVERKQHNHTTYLGTKVQEQQYLIAFAEALLDISEKKTRFYFSKSKLLFLEEKYYPKVNKDLKEKFEAANPGQVFNSKKSTALKLIQNSINRTERIAVQKLEDFQNAVNSFRINLLSGHHYDFQTQDNFKVIRLPAPIQSVNLSTYNPKVLDKYPLPKYILVFPFTERTVRYKELGVSLTKAWYGDLDSSRSWHSDKKTGLPVDTKTGKMLNAGNLTLQIAKEAIREAETEVRAGRAPFFPEIGLTAKIGIEGSTYRQIDELYQTTKSYTRNDDLFIGIGFRWNIWDGGQRRMALANAKLRLENAKAELKNVQQDIEDKISQLHNQITDNVAEITKLIAAYFDSHLEEFLDQDTDEVSVIDKKQLVDDHFLDAEELAIRQHDYLRNTLHLLALRNELDPGALVTLEKLYFVDCKDYNTFLDFDNLNI